MLVKPDEIADPICMGIARDDNVVANVVFVQSLKCPVSIRLVAILAIRSNQCFSSTLVVANRNRQGRDALNRELTSRGDHVPMHHNRADLHFHMQ